MAKPDLILIPCVGCIAIALTSFVPVFGSDPVVRQHLRNIDETPKPTAEFENLFETPTFEPPSEFAGAEIRRWRDNTGAYEVQARLIMIYPEKVKLQKENGRTTTVSMRRLSPLDQAYVRWVADQMTRTEVQSIASDR
jgi:hypothetical protein